MFPTGLSSHSSDVRLWLDCGVHGRVELTRLAPDGVTARHGRPVPPCDALLVVSIDGVETRRPVRLDRGFSETNLHVGFADDATDLPF